MADRPTNLDEAVLAVQNGEVLTIARDGRPVAVLMGVDMYDALKAKLGLDAVAGTSTSDDANAGLHQVGGWLSLRCSFCGHWERGQFTKDQVAGWLRVHRNAGISPNEGHATAASTCPHPCGTPLADEAALAGPYDTEENQDG